MKTFWALLLGLLSAGRDADLRAQERSEGETREVRVYLIDRTRPDREFKDAVAVLTLERPSGRGRTFLMPRTAKHEAPPAAGLIRGLTGTPYFVELNLGDAAPEPAANGEKQETPAGGILRRVHQGAFFAQKVPAALVSEAFTATITIRMGDLTFTTEEFQGPRSPKDAPDQAMERIERSLAVLKERAEEQAGFMDLRPSVVDLLRDLSRLAPAGFEDVTGAFELDRQWCIAQARAIEKACYSGDTGWISELTLTSGPRVRQMKSVLARWKEKPPQPEPELPAK
jgi:hypothetical protein